MPILSDPLPNLDTKLLLELRIGSMEIYQYDNTFIQDHLPGVDNGWTCGLFKISSGGRNGWEEFRLPPAALRFDVIRFASVFRSLKGLSVHEALAVVQASGACWGEARQQLAEAALLSLSRHLQINNAAATAQNQISASERSHLFDCSTAYYSF